MFIYFKMKRNEWKVKAQFYGMIVKFIDNPKDAMEALEKLLISLPNVPTSDATQVPKENE